MENAKQKPYLADVYSRLGALLVDTIILGSVGLLLGLIFESVFVKMGQWGVLFGLIIMLLYFGIGNSQFAGGQTLGKKLLKIRVVDKSGAPLNIAKAGLRAIVLLLPFALNGQSVFGDNPPDILINLLAGIIFGGMLALAYLFFFNRHTRQSLHDLAANSIVININAEKQALAPLWKGHLVIVALLFLITTLVPNATDAQMDSQLFKELVVVQKALLAEPEISVVSVHQQTNTFTDDDGSETLTESLTIQMAVEKNILNDEDFAKSLAQKAYNSYASANELDVIYVSLSYGYDIAIASKSNYYNYEFAVSALK